MTGPKEAVSDGGADRDEGGRFLRGNSAAKGNPVARRMAALRRAALQVVGEHEIQALVLTALRAAEGGDIAAAKFVADRVLGTARPAPSEFDSFELPEVLDLNSLADAARRIVEGLASGNLPLEQAQALLAALREQRAAFEAEALEDIRARLARLEGS